MIGTLVGTPDPEPRRTPTVTLTGTNTTTSSGANFVVITTAGHYRGPSARHTHRPALYDDRTIPGEVVD